MPIKYAFIQTSYSILISILMVDSFTWPRKALRRDSRRAKATKVYHCLMYLPSSSSSQLVKEYKILATINPGGSEPVFTFRSEESDTSGFKRFGLCEFLNPKLLKIFLISHEVCVPLELYFHSVCNHKFTEDFPRFAWKYSITSSIQTLERRYFR